MEKKKLIDVTHISSRGSSYRITLPKRVISRLNLKDDDIIAFYEDDGVKIDKIQ
ncbi:MAG: AbrB/MazE/SpoVT family DNA-binding domain-containing protein [Candidatus Thermoplasmatota archaeon]|jgi:bifunctional DNA-binding transcriptional regulator/antitoxin component of YhaV-PrlF toxin-antitoxin module|nr:AbrB/MazE/SpoVT family DNA-binding domain-containing protein [Candidatus Thermoplasmatota archaeon]MCL5955761.1 AbrB/MazE/SpoVT family DNA-binding domain-containing protein [Candidatus Thermoplasmatota archaeon]